MASETGRSPPQQPPLFNATPESLELDAQKIIDTTHSVWDGVVAKVTRQDATFENVIWPIASDENSKSEVNRLLRFYASTSPAKALRDASNAITNTLNDSEVDLYSRRDMFVLVDSVLQKTKDAAAPLDSQSQHLLEKLYRRFSDNGSAIADEKERNSFKAKTKRMKALVRECNRNLHEEKAGLWLTPDELSGAPSSLMSRLKQGQDEYAGHVWLPTKVPFSQPAVSNAKAEATRRRIHYAVQNRMMPNLPLFRELVLLRDETARMLGYPNHFALKTSGKMVQTPETVDKLMSEIRGAADDLAQQDADELLKLKQSEDERHVENADKVFFWDLSYLTRRRDESVRTPNAALREYFELDITITKLLDMFEHLFGARFIPSPMSGQQRVERQLTWHEDVRMYEVWSIDDDSSFLGYAYLDLFPRDGKYTHVGNYALTYSYQKADGTLFYPSDALLMNYAKSTDEPMLLSLGDVRKLFHELGHMLHALFTRVKYSGLHYVDRDFIEAPSMMLEQFFWVERHIKEVSHHYSHIERWQSHWAKQSSDETPNMPVQLTDEAVTLLAQSGNRVNMSSQLKEIFFATYDMLIHSPNSHAELEAMNLTELFNKTRSATFHIHGGEAIGDTDGWEWGHGQTVFRNIINGYDAGFYAYILGRVFALDIFATGFSKDTANKYAGRRYRDMVLRIGGSQPEMKTLTEYLGHEPSTKPYLAWLGGTG